MCKRTSKKKSTVPPFCLLILLSSHQVTQTREEEEEDNNNNKAPLYRSKNAKNKNAHTYSHAQKPSPLWCCWRGRDVRIKIRPRVSSFFCVGLSLVHTFRSPFDVDAFFFFFSAYKQHYQRQNGPIRERLRIGTRPKLRQRRDWETDIESARAAGRDADVYIRAR